jgi:hypothetical protein
MLPEFYLNCLNTQLSASQLLTLEMLVWLLQFHKQVRIERLAVCLALPILYESRRRHVQRFLALPQLSIPLLWFCLIKSILLTQIQPRTQVILPLDRTQWKQNTVDRKLLRSLWGSEQFSDFDGKTVLNNTVF